MVGTTIILLTNYALALYEARMLDCISSFSNLAISSTLEMRLMIDDCSIVNLFFLKS